MATPQFGELGVRLVRFSVGSTGVGVGLVEETSNSIRQARTPAPRVLPRDRTRTVVRAKIVLANEFFHNALFLPVNGVEFYAPFHFPRQINVVA